jgi:nucleoside-triphosphatase THEP1
VSRLILVGGIPGSGKTTAARRIRDRLEARGEAVRCYLETPAAAARRRCADELVAREGIADEVLARAECRQRSHAHLPSTQELDA